MRLTRTSRLRLRMQEEEEKEKEGQDVEIDRGGIFGPRLFRVLCQESSFEFGNTSCACFISWLFLFIRHLTSIVSFSRTRFTFYFTSFPWLPIRTPLFACGIWHARGP